MQIEIGQEGEVVVLPLKSYEQLLNLLDLEKSLTAMFDSDTRVGLVLLEEVRKINSAKIQDNNQLKLNLDENRCKCGKACKHKGG